MSAEARRAFTGATPPAGKFQKVLLNQLKQRMLMLYQIGTEALVFAHHPRWAKDEPFCPVMATIMEASGDHDGQIQVTKTRI
jgi:hypothetical protein